MTLAPGTSLGPYVIVGPLGAGGMGEVYSARDPRLDREVAVKVLPAAFAGDPDRLRRFAEEARAAGRLNHPHILAIYDIGTHEGSPYEVSELLEGETLRERLAGGALPARKAVDYALQIAQGLGAAHDKGIVHRDLKPENLFVTRDGQVKILDFGLAKLTRPDPGTPVLADAATLPVHSDPGVVLGTVGYMSPEQVRGEVVDHRSDIFSFGAILYEMVSGERAFRRGTAVETMTAILNEEPPQFSEVGRNIPPGLERIVQHCLEKRREERFQSVRDLAFDLEALSSLSTVGVPPAIAGGRLRRLLPRLVAGLLVAVVAAGAFLLGARSAHTPPASFKRLTFRQGIIRTARFAPDGQSVLYSAKWGGEPVRVFTTRPESPESSVLPFSKAGILAISRAGEMALLLDPRPSGPFTVIGTLARAPLSGGAPRQLLAEAQAADWSPDGQSLAVVRDVGGRTRLELPIGNVLSETPGWMSHARVSPRGDQVAFIDHPQRGDDGGDVAVVDRSGKKRVLSSGWLSIMGLAWSPAGDEVWFTAAHEGISRGLYAATLTGRERLLAKALGSLVLQDVAGDGRALVIHDDDRMGISCLAPGAEAESDLSWLDYSSVQGISDDGRWILISESGEGGGTSYGVYLRATDGSPAVRLGDGTAYDLSADGGWALTTRPRPESQIVLLPTGPGEPRALPSGGLQHQDAHWFPDGKRVLLVGYEQGGVRRCYIQDVEGGLPRPVGPEGTSLGGISNPISPDGRSFVARGLDRTYSIYAIDGGQSRPVQGIAVDESPLMWSSDGKSLYVRTSTPVPAEIEKLDLETGRRAPWKTLAPADRVGLTTVGSIVMTPDGTSYAYSYVRLLSNLYLVEGLR